MIVIRLVWGTVGGVTAREKSFRKDALVSPQLRQPAHGARVRVTAQHVVVQGKSKWAEEVQDISGRKAGIGFG